VGQGLEVTTEISGLVPVRAVAEVGRGDSRKGDRAYIRAVAVIEKHNPRLVERHVESSRLGKVLNQDIYSSFAIGYLHVSKQSKPRWPCCITKSSNLLGEGLEGGEPLNGQWHAVL